MRKAAFFVAAAVAWAGGLRAAAPADSSATADSLVLPWDAAWLTWVAEADRVDSSVWNIRDLSPGEIPPVDESAVRRRMAELDARSPMEMTWNPVVHSRIAYFAERRRRHIAEMTGRSAQYFPLFEEALDRHGLPLELKYLPIVESALNPNAVSPAGAQGLWQFMYGTARLQGLRIDSYIDERRDPEASTDAACRYLKQLFEMYGDWHLALAAYNAGPGNVNKAIRRHGGRGSYWSIRPFLPTETQGYVPAFLAVVYMMESFEAHGIAPSKPALAHALIDTVHVGNQVDLKKVARGIGMPEEEILALNPMYRLGVVPASGQAWPVRLPLALVPRYIALEADWATAVQEAEAVAEAAPVATPAPPVAMKQAPIVYKVKPGDMLGSIARKHGVTVAQLTKWNGLKGTTIRPGQKLTIHVARGN